MVPTVGARRHERHQRGVRGSRSALAAHAMVSAQRSIAGLATAICERLLAGAQEPLRPSIGGGYRLRPLGGDPRLCDAARRHRWRQGFLLSTVGNKSTCPALVTSELSAS